MFNLLKSSNHPPRTWCIVSVKARCLLFLRIAPVPKGSGHFFVYNRRPRSLLGARQGILKESTWLRHCRLSDSVANRSLSSITSCSGSSWCLYTVKLCPQPGQITFPAHTYAGPHIERPGSSWRTNANMPLSSGHRSRLAIGLRCQPTVGGEPTCTSSVDIAQASASCPFWTVLG
jgi:hypothetical protein